MPAKTAERSPWRDVCGRPCDARRQPCGLLLSRRSAASVWRRQPPEGQTPRRPRTQRKPPGARGALTEYGLMESGALAIASGLMPVGIASVAWVSTTSTLRDRWRRGQRGWPASFPIAQVPNPPLLAALVAWLVAAVSDGSVHSYARGAFRRTRGVGVVGAHGRRKLGSPCAGSRWARLCRGQDRRRARGMTGLNASLVSSSTCRPRTASGVARSGARAAGCRSTA